LNSNILIVFLLLNIIRSAICFIISKNERLPLYYFDFLQYFNGITKFYYANSILCSILTLRIIHILNNSDLNDYKWLKIIEVLKGFESFNSIGFNDKNLIKRYVHKIKSLKLLISILVQLSLSFMILLIITTLVINFNYSDLIKYGLITAINYFIWFHINAVGNIEVFLYYFIVCYYFKLRLKSFNKCLLSDKTEKVFLKFKAIDQLIEDHNRICLDIKTYNRFWKKYYFAFIYTLFPANLLILQLILFEKISFTVFCILFCFGLGTIFSQLIFNFMTASITTETSKSYKALQKFYLHMNYSMNISRKVKVSKMIFS